jgi:NitT/TauT family transport system substrate-binding protein
VERVKKVKVLPAKKWMRSGRTVGAIAATASLALLAACGSSASSGSQGSSLVIATQPDLGYAPLYIVEQEGWLNKALPGTHVKWETLNSGSAMETGMMSGNIDVGAGGVAPFILGSSKGVGWKLLSSLDEANLELVTKPSITSVKSIGPTDKIAVVAPTSIQAIILKAAAKKYLGDPNKLDQNLTIMPHPVAYQSFRSGSVAGALDAPPFQGEEVKSGGHVLLGSYQLFGTSTFNSAFVMPDFYNSHKQEMQVLYQQIQRAITLINSNPSQAAQILSTYEHGTLSAAAAKADITSSNLHYTTTPKGYLAYAKFMKSIGLIDSTPSSIGDLELPTLHGTAGS